MAQPITSTDTNNPATLPKPNTDNASPALNSAQPGSAPNGGSTLAGNPSAPTDAQPVVNPSNNAKAVQQNTALNSAAASTDDYNLRASQLDSNNNRQKVALVGRTGQGTRQLTSGIGTNTNASLGNSLSVVVFEATPEMSESGGTVLVDIGDIRAAASIVIYMGSPSRTFTLNAKFVSRTAQEATDNMTYINRLKAWRMPTIKGGAGIGGAEPETLRLYAYGDVLKGIPCMVNNLSIDYPSDVDYIQSLDTKVWVPIIQNVAISLKEVRSWGDLRTFDYESYKAGTLAQW